MTSLIETRLRAAGAQGRSAIVPFLVAGRPDRSGFLARLREVDALADVLEIGLPFSDPVADGPVIAQASERALADGVHLGSLLQDLKAARLSAPVVLFSYLNPLLADGLESTVARLVESGIAGLVVPDLPFDSHEGELLLRLADKSGLDWIQLLTPLTTAERRRELLLRSRGFVYAVMRAGPTGSRTDPGEALAFLRELRTESKLPVCAGFGLRDAQQVRALSEHASGLVIGTALVDLIERGFSPAPLLKELREAAHILVP